MVQWKGTLPEGKVFDQQVIQLDVLPTVLAAARVNVHPDWKLDGVNLLPYVKGEKTGSPHDALYWRLGQQTAVRRGDWKLVRYDTTADGDTSAANAKVAPRISSPKLYNLARDIGETQDLYASEQTKAKELQEIWQRWNAQLVKPSWGAGGQAQQEE